MPPRKKARKKRKPAKKRASRPRRKPAKKARKKTRRTTRTSKRTVPKRRKRRKKKSDLGDKVKKILAGGVGAGAAAVVGPAVQRISKQEGIPGEIIASAVPIALGGVAFSQGAKNFGGGMMAMGAGLGLLSLFRRIKTKIPGLEEIDMGPLGATVPKIYARGATSQLLIRGNDGALHPIARAGSFGKRRTVTLPDGRRLTGQSLGEAMVDGKKYMPLWLPTKGELKMIHLDGAVPADRPFGAAVAAAQPFGVAVNAQTPFGRRNVGAPKKLPMRNGYRSDGM